MWSTICNQHWTVNEARVVCKQLGYSHGEYYYNYFFITFKFYSILFLFVAVALQNTSFGYTFPIGIYRLQCSGYEESIWDCTYTLQINNICSNENDAAVDCKGIMVATLIFCETE